MDELPNALIKMFRGISSGDIISGEIHYNEIKRELLEKIYFAYDTETNEAETKRKLQSLEDGISFELHEEGVELPSNGTLNVFDLVDSFAKSTLRLLDDDAVCQFKRMQLWRSVSGKLGEDMFIAAFSRTLIIKMEKSVIRLSGEMWLAMTVSG